MDIQKAADECKELGMTAEGYATEKNLTPINCRDIRHALGGDSKKKKKINVIKTKAD